MRCSFPIYLIDGSEELFYISLQPRFSPVTIPAVLSALLSCMQQSFSLLKTYEMAPMNQKVLLFSSLLYFVITRFPDLELENTCLEHLQEELNAELGQSFAHSKFDRFSPAFLATFLVLFDLCAFFDALPLFKLSLYAAFSRSGVFPLQLVNALFLHSRRTLERLSDCDEAIRCIIGATLQRGAVEAPEFAELVAFFGEQGEAWEERLGELEREALECVVDGAGYGEDNAKYVMAGRCLVLLYVWRGGKYAVRSLVENGIVEGVENEALSREYRTFLLYLLCGNEGAE